MGLSNLTSLTLRGNILTSLDPLQFSGLQNLIELDLSGKRLFSITPEAFEGLNSLDILRLDMNRLAAIPLEALIRLPGKILGCRIGQIAQMVEQVLCTVDILGKTMGPQFKSPLG